MKRYQNIIQFQKGLSFEDFLCEYGTEEQCRKVLEKIRWPNGYECRYCKSSKLYQTSNGGLIVYECGECYRQTTLMSGTIFEHSKLPLRKWFLAIYLITQAKNGISMLELKRALGIGYNSAWRLRHKLQFVMMKRDENLKLDMRVEIDDAYLGGIRSGGKVGRGSENKTAFLAALETDADNNPLRLILTKINAINTGTTQNWAEKHLEASAYVVSDAYKGLNGIGKSGVKHQKIAVGIGQKSSAMSCFKWINIIMGNIKNGFKGTYHSFKHGKYGQEFLSEIAYKFNRRYDLKSLVIRLAVACVKTQPRKESQLRLSEA